MVENSRKDGARSVSKMKQTEIGVIPEEWEVVKIANVVNFDNGLAHEGIENENGDFIVINSKFISTEGNVVRKVTKQLKPLVVNDICIVMSDIPNGKALAKCYLVEKNNTYTLNQRIGRITPIKDYPKFFYYVLNRNKYYLSFDSGSGQTNLRKNEVLDCVIPLPPLAEQEAIATALSDADAWIESLEQLIAKKRLIKQGAMQELLTPKDDWKVKKLGEVIESTQLGGNYQNSEEQNDYPLMKMGNLQRGFISLKKIEYVKGQIPSEKDLLKTNDLLFNTRNTLDLVGKVSIWRNELPKAYFNSNIMRISFNKKFIASNVFVNAVFNTKEFLGKLKDIATGTTSVAAIYTRDLFELEFSFPSLSEQERIATILSDMDTELEALEKQLGKAQQIKQGMMQELLTGRVRLV